MFDTSDRLKHEEVLPNSLLNIGPEGAIGRSGVQIDGNIVQRSYMLLGFGVIMGLQLT